MWIEVKSWIGDWQILLFFSGCCLASGRKLWKLFVAQCPHRSNKFPSQHRYDRCFSFFGQGLKFHDISWYISISPWHAVANLRLLRRDVLVHPRLCCPMPSPSQKLRHCHKAVSWITSVARRLQELVPSGSKFQANMAKMLQCYTSPPIKVRLCDKCSTKPQTKGFLKVSLQWTKCYMAQLPGCRLSFPQLLKKQQSEPRLFGVPRWSQGLVQGRMATAEM